MTRPTQPPPTDGPEAATDLSTDKPSTAPHVPSDRDEKPGATGGVPSPTVQQGAKDVKRGLQDTSRAPEAGNAYDRQKQ